MSGCNHPYECANCKRERMEIDALMAKTIVIAPIFTFLLGLYGGWIFWGKP